MKGWADLVLMAAVLAAAWTRTPVGAVVQNATSWLTDAPRTDLLAAFRTELPDRLTDAVAATVGLSPTTRAEGPWTAGLQIAVASQLGPHALDALRETDPEHPERALERRAIPDAVRKRAIRRATAAGLSRPHRLETYARFLPDSDARRARAEIRDVLALATALDLTWPVDPDARVTSAFGYRTHPTLGTRKLHEGVDIAVPIGTPVRSVGEATVSRARFGAVSGKYVVLDHGHGVTSNYCHGSALHVRRGDTVRQGETVMDSGNTGRSTGPHLHFGVRIHGRAIDPAPFRRTHEVAQGEALDQQKHPSDGHRKAELTEVEQDRKGTRDVDVHVEQPQRARAEELVGPEEARSGDQGHAGDGGGPGGPGGAEGRGDAAEARHDREDSAQGERPDGGGDGAEGQQPQRPTGERGEPLDKSGREPGDAVPQG